MSWQPIYPVSCVQNPSFFLEEVDEIMAANEHRIHGCGSLTPASVMQAYNASKELNYGVMEELAVPSVSAIALPLRIDKGAAYAAISIVAISSRMTDSRKPELLELLREKVEELQSRLSRN